MDEFSLHQFIIRKGKTLENTPEFASYKRTYKSVWGSIERIIRSVGDLDVGCYRGRGLEIDEVDDPSLT